MLKVFGTRGRNKHSWRGVSFGDARTVPMGAGVVATSGLVVLTLGLLCGVGVVDSQPTHAATNDDTTISITPASGINLNMTPAAGTQGSFGTATANVAVTTTGAAGYTFTMNTETTDTDLKNSRVDYTTHPDQKITNLTTTTTQSNFSPNKWGYNVNKNGTYLKGAANTYIPVPNSGSSDADRQIEITDAAGSNTYTFTYGVKANNNLPAGEYATTLVFSATANAIPLISMQEATYANCGENMYDNRSTDAYKEIEYTTAEINGLCWTTRSLDLPGGTKLSHADTNVPEGYSTTTAGFTNGDTLPASSTSGFSSNTTAYVYNSNSTTCGNNSPCYSYYSWLAATAGYNSSSSSTPVNYDICPSGWRLPTQAELTTLKNSYSTGTALTGSPFLGVYAGYYDYSQFYGGGSYGYYWSSTASNSNYACSLNFGSSSAYVTYDYKYGGLSVRCVMKPTMQAATQASLAAAMPNEGDTTTLTDSRDHQDYSIAKINNQYWMTKNLNLAGGTKLSHADTNVPEGYSTTTAGFTNGDTLPASSTSGFSDNATAYVYNSNSTTCGNNSPCYSYYSWRAATAGYNSDSSSTPVNYDICPSGWRLPTQAELTTLKNSYNTGAKLVGSPFLGVYAGRYYSSQFDDGGSYGFYWSSTAGTSSYVYGLYFYSSSADVGSGSKRYGYSVRCVAQS